MEVTFRMAVRDMLPEALNQAAQKADRPLISEEHKSIRLKKVARLAEPPDPDDELFVLDTADPVRIIELTWGDDSVDVQLETFDTDQIADEESVAIELLLKAGWEVDLD